MKRATEFFIMNTRDASYQQPVLLKAVEQILAHPVDIKKTVQSQKERHRKKAGNTVYEPALNHEVANSLIAFYSTRAGLAGGATALVGIVPGIGTAVRLFGTATADMALCLKYQVEMSMALAHLYGHDIETEAGKKRYFIIAGLSTINTEAFRQGSSQAARVFTQMARRYLQNATQDTIKILFRKVPFTLSKKALQKAIPFGIGAVIGFSSNKTLTWLVGQKAKAFFADAASI